MDKLAYHFNKKKIPAKTEGKYKYYYPCLLKEEADEQYGDNYYIVTEVSESEWEALCVYDKISFFGRFLRVCRTISTFCYLV